LVVPPFKRRSNWSHTTKKPSLKNTKLLEKASKKISKPVENFWDQGWMKCTRSTGAYSMLSPTEEEFAAAVRN
jgi:hypothetical protein